MGNVDTLNNLGGSEFSSDGKHLAIRNAVAERRRENSGVLS